ncbi:391_t:CDS:2, partial [Cetraspora pellucida]
MANGGNGLTKGGNLKRADLNTNDSKDSDDADAVEDSGEDTGKDIGE